MKKISVITVNFNHAQGLAKTMKSVLMQTYSDIEYIVIDGGSTDGSVDIVNQYCKRLAYSCSEADCGVYDGMNKGIFHATGDYVLFMNSGDSFCNSDVLANVFGKTEYDSDLIVGRQYQLRNGVRRANRHIFANEVDSSFFISNTLPHQATFIKRSLLTEIGGYNLSYKIVADWVFWYEAVVNHQATVCCVETFVAEMEEEGISSDIDKCRAEMAQFLKTQYPTLIIGQWKNIILQNGESFLFRRATKSKLGKLLVKIALRLNK